MGILGRVTDFCYAATFPMSQGLWHKMGTNITWRLNNLNTRTLAGKSQQGKKEMKCSTSACSLVCLFVCGIRLTSGQLINELLPDYLKVMLFTSCFTPQGQ